MKKITKFLMTSVLLLTGAYGINNFNETKEVEAAAGVDDSQEKWYAIGTINGTSWNKDFELVYDSEDDRYELQLTLQEGNEFKVRLDKSWTTSIGYGGNTGAGIETYLENSGGNFKVKATNDYLIWVKDDNVSNYGDKSYGFGIEVVEVTKYDVSYYNGTTLIATESITEGATLTPTAYDVEGYRLEGWYTDPEFTTKFVNDSKITGKTELYGNYVEAKDYKVYLEASGLTTTPYVYMYHTHTGKENVSWPGVALTQNSDGLYVVEISASVDFNKIIFNGGNGAKQTGNLELSIENGTLYTLIESGSGYDCEITSTNFMVGKTEIEDANLGNAAKFFSALPVEAKTNSNEQYNVGFKFAFIKAGEEEVSTTGYFTCDNLESITYDEKEHVATEDGYLTYFAVIVYNIPDEYVGGTVIVTPAYQNTYGHTVMCVAKSFTL